MEEISYYFDGSFSSVPDSKGRVTLPAPYREMLHFSPDSPSIEVTLVEMVREKKFVFIAAFPPGVFEAKMDAGEKYFVASNDLKGQKYIRIMRTKCRRVNIDSAGRVLVSKDMLQKAGITDKVQINGGGDYIEIWSPNVYADYCGNFEELSDYAASKGFLL